VSAWGGQYLVGAEFEDDVDVGRIFEGTFVFDHEFGFHGFVDFNFGG
jgi:hypothetical protein